MTQNKEALEALDRMYSENLDAIEAAYIGYEKYPEQSRRRERDLNALNEDNDLIRAALQQPRVDIKSLIAECEANLELYNKEKKQSYPYTLVVTRVINYLASQGHLSTNTRGLNDTE